MGEKKELHAQLKRAQREAKLLRAKLLVAQYDNDTLEHALRQALAEFGRVNTELEAVYASRRWRLTEPLSRMKQRIKKTPPPTVADELAWRPYSIPADGKTALVLDRSVPAPDKDAGSRAALGYIRVLADMGYRIVFMGEDFAAPQPYTSQLEALGATVLYGEHYALHWREWLAENAARIQVCMVSRPNVAKRFLPALRQLTQAQLLYMGVDLHFLRLQRAQQAGEPVTDAEIEVARAMEYAAMAEADATLLYSKVEAKLAKREFGIRATVVPLFFYDDVPVRETSFSQTDDILFVGGFAHPPNVDAVRWFVAEVLPLIQRDVPDARLHVVGASPPPGVRELAGGAVQVVGHVSDAQLREYYRNCRVCVVPLRYGAGVKGKTLEAMYHGLPLVSTAIGTEGLPRIKKLVPATDTPQDFARRTVELYTDETLWQCSSVQYREYLLRHFSYGTVKYLMESILHEHH